MSGLLILLVQLGDRFPGIEPVVGRALDALGLAEHDLLEAGLAAARAPLVSAGGFVPQA